MRVAIGQGEVADGMTVETAKGTNTDTYESVCRVRHSAGRSHRTSFCFDEYSHHYSLSIDHQAIAALTVTRLIDGAIDCQEHYPTNMLIRFRALIGSACKLCVDQQLSRSKSLGRSVSRALVRAAIRHQLQLGMRLDIINLVPAMVPYYRRLGYRLIQRPDFVHPSLGTASKVMWLAADAATPSIHQDLFQKITNPLPSASVESVLRTEDGYQQFERGVSLGMTYSWSGYDGFKTDAKLTKSYYDAVHRCFELALGSLLPEGKAGLALDIACGSGRSTHVVGKVAQKVIGVDSCGASIELAHRTEFTVDAEFQCHPFQDYETEETFDLVCAAWFHSNLHTEEEQVAMAKKIRGLMQPDGKVCFIVPGFSFTSRQMQVISRGLGWHQAWMEQVAEYTRGVFTFDNERWLRTTIWQPMHLLRLYRPWFELSCWDVKGTLVQEERLQPACMEPPFEVLYGQVR